MQNIAVISFYSFINIPNPGTLLYKILYHGKRKSIKGTILLAHEGFNGSIAGKKESLEFLVEEIIKQTNATDINIKVNYSEFAPFNKLKVKLKPEIINMGIDTIDINKYRGRYIEANNWDNFISQKDVILIDTRNDYEIEAGTFKNSLNPHTKTFKQFPEWFIKNKSFLEGKKIAMYCTGGIRCEKSTSYLTMHGFKDVYHLKGGILQYLEDTKNQNNLWEGVCFVFDEREVVDNNLSPCKKMESIERNFNYYTYSQLI